MANSGVLSVSGTSPVASSGGATPAISLSSGYGDTQNPYASKTANNFLAAPDGSSGVPTFRAIVAADIPTLNQNTTGTASNVTGTVAVANGGTGATTASDARTNLDAQVTLVSGTNIKTINSTSLLGSGDIVTGDVTLTGTQTLTNKTVEAGTFTNGYTEETVTANTSTAYTIDLANGTVQILTLTGNCTYTFPTATAGKSFMLLQKQDATGSRTVTWPSSVKWPGSTAPTITATASKGDKYVFTADGTYWWGSTAGQNYL